METEFVQCQRDLSVKKLVGILENNFYIAVMENEAFLGLITRSDVLNYLRKKV